MAGLHRGEFSRRGANNGERADSRSFQLSMIATSVGDMNLLSLFHSVYVPCELANATTNVQTAA